MMCGTDAILAMKYFYSMGSEVRMYVPGHAGQFRTVQHTGQSIGV